MSILKTTFKVLCNECVKTNFKNKTKAIGDIIGQTNKKIKQNVEIITIAQNNDIYNKIFILFADLDLLFGVN